MKTALVTGGSGFVGTHFCRWLSWNGWNVYNVDLVEGDDCRYFFHASKTRFDLVVHLAAIVGGRLTIENDPLSVATDLSIDAEMFNWAVRTKQPRVVYYSSSAAYPVRLQDQLATGTLHEAMIDLDWIAKPDFTYGWAKLTGELLAEHARGYGTKVYVLRPFSGYGPGQSLDYPFPSFARRALLGEDPFTIWGDGTARRDFIHISDVVAGTMAVVDADCQAPVNLCTGRGTSFNDLATLFGAANIEHDLSKPVGVAHRVGDPTFSEAFYTPQVTLEQGIKEALNG